jgi:hypothetical protein
MNGTRLELTAIEARLHVPGRLSAITGAAFILGWVAVILAVAMGAAGFDVALDPWIRAVQAIGCLTIVAAGVGVCNAWVICRGCRFWWVKVSSVLIATALLYLTWFAFAFSLISRHLNY